MTSHVLLPFWLLWSPVLAGLISALLYMGPTLVARTLREHKFYFGLYASFIAAGIAIGILSALAAYVLDGHTPQSFYTQLWFQLLLIAVIYAGAIQFKKAEASAHEKKNRPVGVRQLSSEKAHTYQGFPYLLALIVWLAFLLADILLSWEDKHFDVVWIAVPVVAVWLFTMLYVDAKKPIPQSIEEWQRFMPVLFQLYVAFALGVSALIGAT